MITFNEYVDQMTDLQESADVLLEKLITFGGQAYPKFGNIVILAGGAGSGKGFVKDSLVGMEGKVFDVDDLKKLASRTSAIIKKVKDEMGVDLVELGKNLRNPDNVGKLHGIIGEYLNLPDKQLQAFYASVLTAPAERKPNIIFDVTLKDLRKLEKITRQVSEIGYDKSNVHIVWIVNDIEVAKKQNSTRDRVVPAEILVNTHRGASQTMMDITNMGTSLKRYMDGDIVFVFNKVGVDGELIQGDKKDNVIFKKRKPAKAQYLKSAEYIYIKRKGKEVTPADKISKEVRHKIAEYVPKNVNWDF